MNDLQNRLAELLKVGAGDPPSRITVQAVRRRMARRRVAAAAGAAAAIAGIAAVSAGRSRQLGNPGPAGRPGLSAGARPFRWGWALPRWAGPAVYHPDRSARV